MELEFIPGLPEDLEPYLEQIKILVGNIGDVRCTPEQSGYEVRECIVTKSGTVIPGGNHEYGRTCGLHGEESVMSATLQMLGKADLKEVLALGIKMPDKPRVAEMCGNCRDVLAAFFLNQGICYNPELPVLGIGPGKEGKAQVAVARLKDYYFEDFRLYEGEISPRLKEAIDAAGRSYSFAYNVFGKDTPSHPTGAAAIAGRGKRKRIYPGTFIGDVAYHPAESVLIAKGSAYADGAVDIEAMVIVAEEMPHVPYRQRQYLIDISPGLEVYLVSLSKNKIYKTTPAEMLPNNFGWHNLGMSDAVQEWKEKIRRTASGKK